MNEYEIPNLGNPYDPPVLYAESVIVSYPHTKLEVAVFRFSEKLPYDVDVSTVLENRRVELEPESLTKAFPGMGR
ncbi:hypothetical protein, partial [Staphylococcus aureus]|uniref:hypothetical protein n=1 Tax=Staphylococcus aureus TaxID=1280 RepID=UPI001C2E5194